MESAKLAMYRRPAYVPNYSNMPKEADENIYVGMVPKDKWEEYVVYWNKANRLRKELEDIASSRVLENSQTNTDPG